MVGTIARHPMYFSHPSFSPARMLLSLWATQRVKSTYAKYSQIPAASGETGAEVASQILDRAGIT